MTNKILNFSFSKAFRIENTFKNSLIFFPLLLSDRSANISDIITLICGFFIFTLITSICYATNDYTDLKKDLINKLKTKKSILKKNTIIVLNFFLLLFLIFLFYFSDFYNFYLILYLISFYLFNFFIKNFFFVDLFFLTTFYILRLFYGSELIGLNMSYWFLFFFMSFFLIFSTFKRMIQISVNNLNTKTIIYTIAGPICESSDILVKNINLPKQEIDNYLAILDVGAYGAVMASNYNSRGIPKEFLIFDDQYSIIRNQESITETIKLDIIPNWLKLN